MFRRILKVYRWVFARSIFRKFNIFIFHLSLRAIGVLNYENNKVSGEHYFIRKILPQIINKNPVFFDVGANIGNYTLSFLETYPDAEIYAFEPHPSNFYRLKRNISSSNARLYNIALGENRCDLTLYDRADYTNGSSHASLYEAVISEIHKQDVLKFQVSVDVLDDICDRERIGEIDFIKIDTEGNELSVLRGAKEMIERKRIKCIQFEFNEMNIVSRTFFRDFRQILQGYNLYRLLPHGLILLNNSPVYTEIFAYQNIIAIPNNIKLKI